MVPLIRSLVQEKPTRDPYFVIDLSDAEYERLGQLVNFAELQQPTLIPSDLPLLRTTLESSILDQIAVMILIHYGQITNLETARRWLTDAQLVSCYAIFLHSNVSMPQDEWTPIALDALMKTGTQFSFSMSEQLHAMMSLLYCRYGRAISHEVLHTYFTLVAELDLLTIECDTFGSLAAMNCRFCSHQDIVTTILEEVKTSPLVLFTALKGSSSVKAFHDWPINEESPRHFPTWSETWQESYSTDSFIELFKQLKSVRGWSPAHEGASEIILHAHWSMENVHHEREWQWSSMGYRSPVIGEALLAARARRLGRTQAIIDRLLLLETTLGTQ